MVPKGGEGLESNPLSTSFAQFWQSQIPFEGALRSSGERRDRIAGLQEMQR